MDSVENMFQSFRISDVKEDVHAYTEYLEGNASGKITLIPTGYSLLDQLLSGGLALGDLVVLGGVPGSGKTSFMLNIALSLLQRNVRLGFLEGEMTREQIFTRMNSIYAGVSKDIVRSGKQFERANKPFLHWLYEQPLHFVECTERTPRKLKELIDHLASVKKCQVVFVDYLQTFRERSKGVSEYDEVSKVSALLRQLALKYKICIFAASSLNRTHVSSDDKPGLHSFRGSGQIEHDMGTGFILLGEENVDEELRNRQRKSEIHLVKGREHAKGIIGLNYNLATQGMSESACEFHPQPVDDVFAEEDKDGF